MNILYVILAIWFIIDFGITILLFRGGAFLPLTETLIKWILRKILGRNACAINIINLHEETFFTEKHHIDYDDEKLNRASNNTCKIYVNKCKNCERRLISFHAPWTNMFDGWQKRNIKEGQRLKGKKAY